MIAAVRAELRAMWVDRAGAVDTLVFGLTIAVMYAIVVVLG